MPSQAQAHIYDILTTHDIPITREDISWAFSSSKTAVEIDEYAEKYLGPECFLSLEEAEIYEHIKETHLLKLHKSRDLAAVNPHTEEYLRLEIERLKASTESHRKHTEILKRQKIVLDGLKKQEKQVDDNRKRLRERRRKKWVGEREKVVIEIENLIIALRNQIKDLQHDDSQSTAPNTTASNLVDLNSLQEMLASDDKILKKLERLAEETDVGDIDGSKEQKVVDKVRLMTQKLSDLLTAVVRTRLDRVYSETLGCPKEWTFVKSEEENQVIYNLQKDLEGLDLEIPAVSKMSTEGEFLRPVLGEVKKRKALLEDIVGGRGSYVCEVLQHLQKRIHHHIQLLEKDLYKKKALVEISAQLENIAQSPLPARTSRDQPGSNTPPSDPSKLGLPRTPGRASSSPTKHLPMHLRRPQQSYGTPETPKRSSGKYRSPRKRRDADDDDDDDDDEESGEPEIDLLLHLGINLPAHLSQPQTPGTPFARDTSSGDTSSAETQRHLIKQFVTMNNRVMQQEASLEKTVRGVIASSISESANLARIATDAVWIDRPFGSSTKNKSEGESTLEKLIPPGLVAEDVMKSVGETEKEVHKLGMKMGKVQEAVEVLEESDGAGLGVGAVEAKLRFVRRWGR